MFLTRILLAARTHAARVLAALALVVLAFACDATHDARETKDDDERKVSRFVTLNTQAALVAFIAREHPRLGYEHLAITGTIDNLTPLAALPVPVLDFTIGPTTQLVSTHGIEHLDVRGSLTLVDNAALATLWGPRLSFDSFSDPACVTIARAPQLRDVHLASLPHADDCLAIRDADTAHNLCALDVGDACPTLRDDLCSDGALAFSSGCAQPEATSAPAPR